MTQYFMSGSRVRVQMMAVDQGRLISHARMSKQFVELTRDRADGVFRRRRRSGGGENTIHNVERLKEGVIRGVRGGRAGEGTSPKCPRECAQCARRKTVRTERSKIQSRRD